MATGGAGAPPAVLKPVDQRTPKPENHTRFVCISDTHNMVAHEFYIPSGDVLLHAGDFTDIGLPEDVDQFVTFITSQPHRHKVVIAGNHDLTFDSKNYGMLWKEFCHPKKYDTKKVKDKLRKAHGVTYLEDSGTKINGLHIWGSPWQPEFCGSAFNLPRGKDLQQKWDLIPDDVDILITHGPPKGYGDRVIYGGKHVGCSNLLQTVQKRVKPKYHVFGHIHEGYGITTDGVTTYINASTCSVSYRPINAPIIFDIPSSNSSS